MDTTTVPAYVPTGQPVQLEAPIVTELWPVGQTAQGEELETENVCFRQAKQLVDADDPVVALYVPEAHPMHDVWPTESWYMPYEQSTHSELPTVDENCPATHARQLALDDAPVVDPYVPKAHPRQLTEEVAPAAAK